MGDFHIVYPVLASSPTASEAEEMRTILPVEAVVVTRGPRAMGVSTRHRIAPVDMSIPISPFPITTAMSAVSTAGWERDKPVWALHATKPDGEIADTTPCGDNTTNTL